MRKSISTIEKEGRRLLSEFASAALLAPFAAANNNDDNDDRILRLIRRRI